ncbi:MAG: hypothetical protein KJ749_14875, partial [Planctomycetes bacterium]|nr:hypothetical protein [Planctomycetota bacterium]
MRRTDSQHLGSDHHLEPASRFPRVIRLRMAGRQRFRRTRDAPHLSPLGKGGFPGVIRLPTAALVGATFVVLMTLALWQPGCGLEDVGARPDPVAAENDDEYPADDGLVEDESLTEEGEAPNAGVRVYHRDATDSEGFPSLHSWVDTGTTGIFLVLEAAAPPAEVEAAPRYLAYWRHYETELLYVYQRLLFDWVDVGHSLVNLERDLGVPLEPITEADAALAAAVAEATGALPDPTEWRPATYRMLERLMGLGGSAGAETR